MPAGASINPDIPILSDELVFKTHARHSDFDFYTLAQDRERALQFFRWKAHIEENVSPVIAVTGDVIQGITNCFSRRCAELVPLYPVDHDRLPQDTKDHIESIRRECLLDESSIMDAFASSERFSLELLGDLTPGQGGRLCRTLKCRITSTDGRPVEGTSPTMCVKLFDDRFLYMDPPEGDILEAGPSLEWWWTKYTSAEERVRNEDAAYKKLAFAQGSLVPRFYGSHLASLACPIYSMSRSTSLTVHASKWSRGLRRYNGICLRGLAHWR